ncbi:hypothetical protein V6N12_073285 [Hibiscus sabdariffa]|uniref:Uncharacterized protein n=1 Tax=Hibiscus sabdariffa TaxID=183260 RepID=A0ABR2A521_9ROSI
MTNTESGSNLSSQAADELVSSFGSGSGEQASYRSLAGVISSSAEPAWFSSFTFPLQVTVGTDASNTSHVSHTSEGIPQPASIVEVDPAGACLSQQQCGFVDASQAQQCVVDDGTGEVCPPHQQDNGVLAVTSQPTHPGIDPGILCSEPLPSPLPHCDPPSGISDTLPVNSSSNAHVNYVTAESQTADVFTKPLSVARFLMLRQHLCVHGISELQEMQEVG